MLHPKNIKEQSRETKSIVVECFKRFLLGESVWFSEEPRALKRAWCELWANNSVFCVWLCKVKHVTSKFKKPSLENFNLLALGASELISEISHTFKGSKFQPVGVSEWQTAYLLCTVIPCLWRFNLVIEKNYLWACFAKHFVFGLDLTKNCVRFINHVGKVVVMQWKSESEIWLVLE
jgi:hypothetical protein